MCGSCRCASRTGSSFCPLACWPSQIGRADVCSSDLTMNQCEAHRPYPSTLPVRTYVWELPVRISHWFIVLSIGVLAFTDRKSRRVLFRSNDEPVRGA